MDNLDWGKAGLVGSGHEDWAGGKELVFCPARIQAEVAEGGRSRNSARLESTKFFAADARISENRRE